MSDTLHTRTARPEDGPRLYALDHAAWSTLSEVAERAAPPTADSTVFDERHRPDDYLVAEAGGELVGYIRLVPPTPLPSNAHVRQISGLAVDDAARGPGCCGRGRAG